MKYNEIHISVFIYKILNWMIKIVKILISILIQ